MTRPVVDELAEAAEKAREADEGRMPDCCNEEHRLIVRGFWENRYSEVKRGRAEHP